MARAFAVAVALLLAFAPAVGDARGHGGGGHSSSGSHSSGSRSSASGGSHHSTASHSTRSHSSGSTHRSSSSYKASSFHRTSHGHGQSKRDPEQRRAFMHGHPCPSTGKTSGACPGYVVDHVTALKHGGLDRPSNMQWQTVAAAKAKDKWE